MMENAPRHKAEMDWNDLLKKPARLFGYSYFYFIIILGILGYLYISNLTNIGKNSIAPAVLVDSSAFIQDIPMQSPRVIPPIDIIKAGVSSPELVSKGKELFKANCSSCHGDNGQGDGATASALNPKPRNFHSFDGWKNGTKVTQIYKTLQEGITGSAMASYSYMPPEDRFALIHFIRSFMTGHPVDSADELKQLDAAYQLSNGMNVSGQIPVKKAMRMIIAGSEPRVIEVAGIEKSMMLAGGEGALLFKRFVFDERKAIASFVFKKNALINTDELIKIISADPVNVGFEPGVVNLSSNEWAVLFRFLSSQNKIRD